jgi:hypothetical protein
VAPSRNTLAAGGRKFQGKEIQYEIENKLSFLEEKNVVKSSQRFPHTHTKNRFNINNSLVCEVYGAGLYKKGIGRGGLRYTLRFVVSLQ